MPQNLDFTEHLGYEAVFDCLPDPILIYDHSNKRFLNSNDAATKRYGYSHDEFLNICPWHFEAPYDESLLSKRINGLKTKGTAVYSTEHRTRDGETFPVEMHTIYRNVNGTDIFIATCRELTDRIESQTRLEAAENHHRAIFETTTSLISVIDLNAGMFLDVNPAFESLLGYSKEKLISTPFNEFIHPDDLEKTSQIVKDNLILGKETIDFQNRYRTSQGEYVWLEWSSRPFACKDLLDKGIIYAIAHHVSVQKEIEEKLREQNQRMRLHVEQTLLGVIEWDTDFNVQQWNTAAETIFGYTKEEAIGQHGSFIIPNDRTKELDKTWNKLLKHTGGNRSLNQNVRKGGELLTCEWINTSLVDSNNTVVGVASLVFDVTESEIQKKELELAKESAEKANQAKSEFLSVMSHELRTPLNSIVGPCQLLQADVKDETSRRLLEIMLSSSAHLLELINRILDLSKIESGTLDLIFAPVQLEDFLKHQLLPLQTSAEKKGLRYSIKLNTSSDATLITDGRLLTQALINIVGNAIKFTQQGSIEITVSNNEDNYLIEITDTGIGIQDEVKEQLFEPFKQGENAIEHEQKGTGLGLSITKSIIEKLNGKIEVQSSPGKGSTFSITLPNLNSPVGEKQHSDQSNQSKSEQTAEVKILLVDDELNNQVVLGSMLNFLNYEYDLAKSGEEAIKEASKNEYDIIFMDIKMPGIDGIEAGKAIRQLSGNSSIQIIAQSAYALKEQKEDFLQQGMDDYLSKPIELEALRATLEKAKNKLARRE